MPIRSRARLVVGMIAAAISEAFVRAGITRQDHQAAVLGLSKSRWCKYVHGHQSPTESQVASWMESARGLGFALELRWCSWQSPSASVER